MILRIPALHSLSQIKKADHPVKIEIEANDSNGQLVELLNCIRHKGNVGHSFIIIVDPDIRESTERFSWDGDGWDRIQEIKVNGEVLKYTKDRLGRCHDEKGHLVPCNGSSAAGAKTKTPGSKPEDKPKASPAAGLSHEARATIEHYKRTGYAKMNAHLRRGDKAHMLPDERKKAVESISQLEKVIDSNPLPKDTRVFRGIGDPEIFRNFDNLKGATISDAGFVSTSESVDIAAQHARSANMGIKQPKKPKRGIIAVINLPKGSKAVSLGADDSEKEVIVQRASKFRVTSTDKSGPYWRIDLEAVA